MAKRAGKKRSPSASIQPGREVTVAELRSMIGAAKGAKSATPEGLGELPAGQAADALFAMRGRGPGL